VFEDGMEEYYYIKIASEAFDEPMYVAKHPNLFKLSLSYYDEMKTDDRDDGCSYYSPWNTLEDVKEWARQLTEEELVESKIAHLRDNIKHEIRTNCDPVDDRAKLHSSVTVTIINQHGTELGSFTYTPIPKPLI
jgi:hypothetical protein